MSILSIIILVLVLVAIIAYFKQLSKENRALQASVIRDTSALGVVATATFAKDVLIATVNVGKLAAKTVEAEHQDTIKSARAGMVEIPHIKTKGLNGYST